jgi:hypothetical protein
VGSGDLYVFWPLVQLCPADIQYMISVRDKRTSFWLRMYFWELERHMPATQDDSGEDEETKATMKPKDIITWALSITATFLAACIALCGMYGMVRLSLSPGGVLTPCAFRSLVILLVASLVATLVTCYSRVTAGRFQFSGLGITFKGVACQATLWVVVFISFSGAFLALTKCLV